MSGKSKVKANVTAMIYAGEFGVVVECPGAAGCGLIRHFVEPAEEGDPCAFLQDGCGCGNLSAHRQAMEALRDAINSKLETQEA